MNMDIWSYAHISVGRMKGGGENNEPTHGMNKRVRLNPEIKKAKDWSRTKNRGTLYVALSNPGAHLCTWPIEREMETHTGAKKYIKLKYIVHDQFGS